MESSLIKQNAGGEEAVSSPLPGSVLACDNTGERVCVFFFLAGGGRGNGDSEWEGSDLISFMLVGASEESDVFHRCSPLFLLAPKVTCNPLFLPPSP